MNQEQQTPSAPVAPQMPKSNRGFKITIVILTIICLGLGGFIVYQSIDKNKSNNDQKQSTKQTSQKPQTPTPADTPQEPKTPDLTQTVCHNKEGLCFRYPDNWKIETSKVDSGIDNDNREITVVSTPTGAKALRLSTGGLGIGGPCPEGKNTSVEVAEAKVIGNGLTAVRMMLNDQNYIGLVKESQEINQTGNYMANACFYWALHAKNHTSLTVFNNLANGYENNELDPLSEADAKTAFQIAASTYYK